MPNEALDWARVYSKWAWLVPSGCRPLFVTQFADVFLTLPDGTVALLDLEQGSLDGYSDSPDGLASHLLEDPNRNELLYIPLVDKLSRNGINLGPAECYHFKIPTILGGEFHVENVVKTNVNERGMLLGDLQKQVVDQPDGEQISVEWRGD